MDSNIVNGIFTLAGVAVGFGLVEITAWVKSCRRHQKLKSALKHELTAIKRMIPFRQSILSKAVKSFSAGRIFDPAAVHFPRAAYETILENAPELLTVKERDCLHISYERLRVVDAKTDSAVSYFDSISGHSPIHAAEALATVMSDMEEALLETAPLLESLIKNKPIDVFKDVLA